MSSLSEPDDGKASSPSGFRSFCDHPAPDFSQNSRRLGDANLTVDFRRDL
jgi:hypothetical protein